MKRWGIVLTLVVFVAAIRVFGRPPAPESIRTAVKPASAEAVARGRVVYERYGCTLCHGADAKGGFPNTNALRDSKVPSVIETADVYTAAEVAQLIRAGRSHVDRSDEKGVIPPYRMPGWGDRMSEQEVNDVVQYLMSLFPKAAKKKGWG